MTDPRERLLSTIHAVSTARTDAAAWSIGHATPLCYCSTMPDENLCAWCQLDQMIKSGAHRIMPELSPADAIRQIAGKTPRESAHSFCQRADWALGAAGYWLLDARGQHWGLDIIAYGVPTGDDDVFEIVAIQAADCDGYPIYAPVRWHDVPTEWQTDIIHAVAQQIDIAKQEVV